ncbi:MULTISPECIES: SdiA-regulated domain-containing protein [unclassified Pseudomonas]|uniref:SdiA-regulated domain-containing protein n=1 Tax=unclassified Pseudomonas TaxID=196821 RepID=UPI0035C15E3B
MAIPSAGYLPSLPRKRRTLLPWLALGLVAAYGLSVLMHWDDRARLWVKEHFETPAERVSSTWLPDYVADIDAKVMPGVGDAEASDLTFNPKTRTLFTVTGKRPFLVELSLDGDVLRKMPLLGWSNPEGVAMLENGQMAIIDERTHLLTLVKVDANTRALNHADFKSFDLGESADDNKGFEGIAWDPKHQQLVLGEERPAQLFTWRTDGRGPLAGDKQALPSSALEVRNLSGLTIDPRTGHLLVLSADSNLLLELNERGEQVSFMTLLGGFNGLASRVPRAEGVAMDDKGNLYVVSEPDLFYRFKKR